MKNTLAPKKACFDQDTTHQTKAAGTNIETPFVLKIQQLPPVSEHVLSATRSCFNTDNRSPQLSTFTTYL